MNLDRLLYEAPERTECMTGYDALALAVNRRAATPCPELPFSQIIHILLMIPARLYSIYIYNNSVSDITPGIFESCEKAP